MLERPVLCHHKILLFLIFKIAAVRHLGILKFKFFRLRALPLRDTFCVIALNFVEICHTVVEILQFFAFL